MELTDAAATDIYDAENRETECLEYLEAAVQVGRRIAREVLKDESRHNEAPNMLAALLASEAVFLNEHHWMKDWPEDARKTVALCANCSDVFAWGCFDAEDVAYREIPDVFDHWRKDREWGVAVWCMKKRNLMPQSPLEKRIRKAGIWDLDAMNLRPNPTPLGG